MAVIAGRIEEYQTLESMYQSDQAEFLALYGRRRIGKTFLVQTFFSEKDAIFFRVTGQKNGTLEEQIRGFTTMMGETFYHGADIRAKRNWFETLDALRQAIINTVSKTQKVVLFFDEFPWMASRKSRLLEGVEYFWNQYWSNDPRIKLIICGSSAAWIVRKIINQKGGLHNRITRKIQLKPFKLNELEAFFNNKGIQLNHRQITDIYMVTGGVPYYLTAVSKGQSAAQIIESLAFKENGILFREFDNLFSSLFEDAESYVELLRILSKTKSGLSQKDIIALATLCSDGGTAVKKLNELVETGFVIKFKSHFNKRKGIYYRLVDEYTLFYLNWIEPIKDTLQKESLERGYWEQLRESGAWKAWAGYAFESVCYQHISEIRFALHLNPTAIADTWRYIPKKDSDEQGAQIDLLFDRRDDAITLCEIKFTDSPYVLDKAEAIALRNRIEIFVKKTGTRKQIFSVLIASSGFKPTLYADDMITQVVTLDDLFVIPR